MVNGQSGAKETCKEMNLSYGVHVCVIRGRAVDGCATKWEDYVSNDVKRWNRTKRLVCKNVQIRMQSGLAALRVFAPDTYHNFQSFTKPFFTWSTMTSYWKATASSSSVAAITAPTQTQRGGGTRIPFGSQQGGGTFLENA